MAALKIVVTLGDEGLFALSRRHTERGGGAMNNFDSSG